MSNSFLYYFTITISPRHKSKPRDTHPDQDQEAPAHASLLSLQAKCVELDPNHLHPRAFHISNQVFHKHTHGAFERDTALALNPRAAFALGLDI